MAADTRCTRDRLLSTRAISAAAIATLALAGAALAGPPAPSLFFTDMTGVAGIDLTSDLTESCAFGDYDNDGDQDLYLTVNGTNRLFRNDGNFRFSDVTVISQTGNGGFSVGCAWGDLDNDDDLDLYVVNFGIGPDVLYENLGPIGVGGEHVFADIAAAAGINIERTSRGMAFIDYNRDGLLDIYVLSIGENLLYHNNGDMTFTNVAPALGIEAPATGVGVVSSDLDNNGWLDLYTGNRSFQISSVFMNDAGTFTDIATSGGVTASGLGMGVHSFDYDNDLDMDLYWTTWPGTGTFPNPNRLYENLGNGMFVDVAPASLTTDPDGWGISNNAGDIDNDGWQDFFVTNGFDASTSDNVLFRNLGDKSFEDITSALEGGAAFDGRGITFGDIDGDGDLDLVVTADAGEPNRMWRNDSTTFNAWATFNLVGTCSNRSAIGARIEVETPVMTTVQEVSGGAGRGSFNSLPVEFGLSSASSITEVRVRWPSGKTQTFTGFAINATHTIIELRAADTNGDGSVNSDDFFQFLTDFFAGTADFNGDGVSNSDDFFGFLDAFFGDGC